MDLITGLPGSFFLRLSQNKLEIIISGLDWIHHNFNNPALSQIKILKYGYPVLRPIFPHQFEAS